MKKILVVTLFFNSFCYSQTNRYSEVTTAKYNPMTLSEMMVVPQYLKAKYDENEDYLYALKKWILELKTQISEERFISRLNGQYSALTSYENDDLARATSTLKKRENDIREIISDYNIFVKKNSTSTQNVSSSGSNKSFAQIAMDFYKNKEYSKAVLNFSKHLENDKNNTDVMFFRALAKSELQDRYGAISDYEKIIELNSNYPMQYAKLATVYNNKAYCLVGLGKYNDALPFVEKALELDKSEAYIWDTRGEIYYNLNNFEKCISDMTKAIEIKENDNSYFFRGLAYIKFGKKEKGCQDLSKAGELGNESAYEKISKNCN